MDYKHQYLRAIEWQEGSHDLGEVERRAVDRRCSGAIQLLQSALDSPTAESKARLIGMATEYLAKASVIATVGAIKDRVGNNPFLVRPDEESDEPVEDEAPEVLGSAPYFEIAFDEVPEVPVPVPNFGHVNLVLKKRAPEPEAEIEPPQEAPPPESASWFVAVPGGEK